METFARRTELKTKYMNKLEHLAEDRQRELDTKRMKEVPIKLNEYSRSKLFHEIEYREKEPSVHLNVTIGNVELGTDERKVLMISP